MLTWNDFEKVEMRVGTVISVSDFPKARNPAFKLTIDFGEYGIKNSSAQITAIYNKEELLGSQIIAVVNFSPKQIADFISECLVLGVVGEKNEVTLLVPERQVTNGMRIA
ncbi:MAG: tRNA-binding protein [Saprospiraceae bacterium]|nr:tRNA-binding protein [Saprospiraceae bacterium]